MILLLVNAFNFQIIKNIFIIKNYFSRKYIIEFHGFSGGFKKNFLEFQLKPYIQISEN